MSFHYIVPTFNKSTPNKVHNDLIITGPNTVSHPTENGWFSAIATESILATVDGEYAFAVRVDHRVDAWMTLGVTPTATFDSSKESFPEYKGMTGSAMRLYDGSYFPGSSPVLIDGEIAEKAKEVIVVVTIANNGARKFVRWIVNGTSSVNHDCTTRCGGNKLFPIVTVGEKDLQVTTIPIDQITIRNDEVNKLIEKCSKQSSPNQSAAAVANNNNQQQPSSAAFAQLQQELEKERTRADLAEAQLQQKDQLIVQLQHEIAELKKDAKATPVLKE